MGHSQKYFVFPLVIGVSQKRHHLSIDRRLQASLQRRPIDIWPSHLNSGQVTKGAGRMPWHQEPKKDVISCEKLRGGANIH